MATIGTVLELHVSCSNLRDSDVLSKSDPLTVLYNKREKEWTEAGRTECIKNSLNPQFSTPLVVQYQFEERQCVQFRVYDVDNTSTTLTDDEQLGTMECTLGEIVNYKVFKRPLMYKGKERGSITVRVEERSGEGSELRLSFTGHGLDKKDVFGKSDPYLEISRLNADGTYSVIHRNNYIKNTLNPVWPEICLTTRQLCNNVNDRMIKVKCYDWDADGGHDLIGEFTTSLTELQSSQRTDKKLEWKLVNPKKVSKKGYNNSGIIRLQEIKVTPIYSFLDYIMAGCTINFTVGIDFTASNGDPTHSSSLHYINHECPNEYLTALRTVGYICQDYDSDKLFPAFGFGGNIGGKVSHEFPLNGNPSNPYCVGVEGVASAYYQSLQSVKLSGPTCMAPIINHVTQFAESAAANKDRQDYYILLILTDGDITDMGDTKRAIIAASHLPVSIIIVGVGSCGFEKMVELDSDNEKLSVGLSVAVRDIVQFVPYRKYAQSHQLASAVLAEVPTQFTDYMKLKGLKPLGTTTAV